MNQKNNNKVLLKGIIFDFDGVIAESVQIKNDAFADLYSPFGNEVVKKVLSYEKNNHGISRFKKIKYYHNSILNVDLSEEKIMELSTRFSELVVDKVIEAPYVPGVLDYIHRSYDKYRLFVSSATPTSEIKQILAGKKIMNYFTAVYGSPESKKNHITDICIKNNLKTEELIFFGDSTSDIDAAKVHGIQFILRIHKHNQTNFQGFIGQKIQNFISLDTNTLFSNESINFQC